MPDDDLRSRIVRAIVAEADLAAGEVIRPAWGGVRAEALRLAADIARGVPEVAGGDEARSEEWEDGLLRSRERGADDGR